MESLSEFFSQVRRLQGLKQSHIAKSLNITQGVIANYEAGRTQLSLETLQKIGTFLNINPLYITGEAQNPFKSDNLIKMQLPESILGGIDFKIIYLIAEKSKALNMIFLITPGLLYRKLKGVYSNAVYAVALQDNISNIFLFKRKSENPLYGERELQEKLTEIRRKNKIRISMSTFQLLNNAVYNKIKDWTATKEDIEFFFADHTDSPLITTQAEDEVTRYLRDNNIDPQELITFLKTNYPPAS